MRIGKLAKLSGLSRDTIRFYEREGLIASVPEEGSSNSYRDYPEDVLERLDVIGKAQDAGFSLADIKKLTGFWDGQNQDFDGELFLDEKAEEVRKNIERAQAFLEMLEATITSLKVDPRG